MAITALALALAGVAYTAEALITDSRDVHSAIPLIKADGFNPGDVGETIGGGEINITPLKVGKCAIDGVDAQLTYRDGKVVDVSNYEIPVDPYTVNVVAAKNMINWQNGTVTVQNTAEFRQNLPGLHC